MKGQVKYINYLHCFSSRTLVTAFFLVVLFCVSACHRKELIYDALPGNRKVNVNIDWSIIPDIAPSGVQLYFYPSTGGKPLVFQSNEVRQVGVTLPTGKYNLLLINQTVTEYSFTAFRNMDSYASALAYAKEIDMVNYVKQPNEVLIANTDPLAVGTLENIDITDGNTVCKCATSTFELNVIPQKVSHKLEFRVYLHNINMLASASVAIQGMARTVNLGTKSPQQEGGTQIFNDIGVTYLNTAKTFGYIHGAVATLGLPAVAQAGSQQQVLKIAFKLVDNKTEVDIALDVTGYIAIDAEGN